MMLFQDVIAQSKYFSKSCALLIFKDYNPSRIIMFFLNLSFFFIEDRNRNVPLENILNRSH